jgi:hypothetical protein
LIGHVIKAMVANYWRRLTHWDLCKLDDQSLGASGR